MVDLIFLKLVMNRYQNLGGDSNVSEYEIGADYILIKFKGTFRKYRYSYLKAGRNHVEAMKKLAKRGIGLNAYINKYVKFLYDR